MDSNTNVEYLKDIVKDFCEKRDWDKFHNPKDLAIAISIECGELLELFRFKSDNEISEVMNSSKKHAVEEEVADVFYCLLRFAERNNIDLATVLQDKLKKNEEKYPVDKAKGSNKKYNEYK